jgi:ABC-type glycerol-3-phosphate transport system substrate-binding protein
MRLVSAAVLLAALALVVAGCGGDNLALCNGCSSPTPQVTTTPTLTATPSPAAT